MEQLEASWRTLSERGVFLVEALSKNAGLNMAELDRLCREYQQTTTVAEVNLQAVLPNAPETREILESLIGIALDLFAHYTGQTPNLLSMGRVLEDVAPGSYAFAQTISGDIDVQYVIILPANLVTNVAAHILQEPVAAVDTMALDAVTEFLNVVVGNTCTKFSMRNYHVTTAPPRAQPLADFLAALTPNPIVVRAGVSDGEFHLVYLLGPRAA